MIEPEVRIAVVTVTYNSAQVLRDFISSLSSQEFNQFAVFAVDNASQDESVAILEQAERAGLPVRIIRNTENVGVAEGNNIGIRLAMQEGFTHVLLLNNDTEFPADLLNRLAACALQDRPIVVPKIYRGENGKTLWYAGGKFSRLRGYTGIHLGEETQDRGRFDVPGLVEYAPTCCMLVSIAVFEAVGMMDARYFVYYDDTDFCLRIYRARIPIWYLPDATLYHKVGSLTGGALSGFAIRMLVRNRIYYFRKNFSPISAQLVSSVYWSYLLIRRIIGKDTREVHRAKMAAYAEGMELIAEYEREKQLLRGSGCRMEAHNANPAQEGRYHE